MGPAVLLLCWGEYPFDDYSVYYAVRNFHFTIKIFKNGCSHGFLVINNGVLFFNKLDAFSTNGGKSDNLLGIADQSSKTWLSRKINTRSVSYVW